MPLNVTSDTLRSHHLRRGSKVRILDEASLYFRRTGIVTAVREHTMVVDVGPESIMILFCCARLLEK